MALPYSGFNIKQRRAGSGRKLLPNLPEGPRRRLAEAEGLIAEKFKGITSDGKVVPGLFRLQKTGVETNSIRNAAEAFLASLDPEARTKALFDIDSDAWRQWCNIHPFLLRHGVMLDEMSLEQRERALTILQASFSPQGFETARNVMKLNDTVREMTGKDEEYGEWLYWLSIIGTPSSSEPWGWQIDGHHLIVNCFLLGDQLVTTPSFLGSEPCVAEEGIHKGTGVFREEEGKGLALMQSLSTEQRKKALLSDDLPGEVFTTAFRDNLELRYEGVRYGDLSSTEQNLLLNLMEIYINRIRPGHAAVKLEEVRAHLSDTYFAWMGGFAEDSVFYYRIHSPVVLIEFDHQSGIVLDNDKPSRHHIHTIVRTPNGNDYGKDLLRQHRELHAHPHP